MLPATPCADRAEASPSSSAGVWLNPDPSDGRLTEGETGGCCWHSAAAIPGGLTMGLLKAVRLDSTLAHLASARLPVGRCDRVLGLRCVARTLWWLPRLPRWDSEPPLDSASSSSESASWCRARRRAVGRGTWGARHREASEHLPPSPTAWPPVRGAPRGADGLLIWARSPLPHLSLVVRKRGQEGKPLVKVTRPRDTGAKSPTWERSPPHVPLAPGPPHVPLAPGWRQPRLGGEWPARKTEAWT